MTSFITLHAHLTTFEDDTCIFAVNKNRRYAISATTKHLRLLSTWYRDRPFSLSRFGVKLCYWISLIIFEQKRFYNFPYKRYVVQIYLRSFNLKFYVQHFYLQKTMKFFLHSIYLFILCLFFKCWYLSANLIANMRGLMGCSPWWSKSVNKKLYLLMKPYNYVNIIFYLMFGKLECKI